MVTDALQAYISPYANPNRAGKLFEIMLLKKAFVVGKVFHREFNKIYRSSLRFSFKRELLTSRLWSCSFLSWSASVSICLDFLVGNCCNWWSTVFFKTRWKFLIKTLNLYDAYWRDFPDDDLNIQLFIFCYCCNVDRIQRRKRYIFLLLNYLPLK